LNWENFAPLQSCIARIERSLKPETFQKLLGKCEWSQKQLLDVMNKITEDENKPFLKYSEFSKSVGDEAAKSLIKHNVFIYRHNKKYAFDLPDAPDGPIVTAASPMEHHAIKVVLGDLDR
jgi:hypothetical protein